MGNTFGGLLAALAAALRFRRQAVESDSHDDYHQKPKNVAIARRLTIGAR